MSRQSRLASRLPAYSNLCSRWTRIQVAALQRNVCMGTRWDLKRLTQVKCSGAKVRRTGPQAPWQAVT